MTVVDEAYEQFKADVTEKVPGKIIMTKVWGSHSHGCDTPESDIDFLAVYKAPLKDVLRMNPPTDTVDHKDPDWQAHELKKFCSLLMKGNPAIVECLYTDQWCDMTDSFASLQERRADFINAQTLKQYLGYGKGQLQRLKAGTRIHSTGGKYNTKWAYHLIRLMFDAKRIAGGNPPQVMKSGAELGVLMNIRQGLWSPEDIEEYFLDLESEIDAMKPWGIPEKADEAALNEWIYENRVWWHSES